MNNRQLNKEFSQMMKNNNKFSGKSGFTDSEEEDDSSKSLKSPKSGRSQISARSSLLSGRSPRDDLPSVQRFRTNDLRKYSPEKSDDFMNSPRKLGRLSNERSLSPKSPKSNDDSFSKYPRFNRNRSHSKEDEDSYNKSQPITPRSQHSARSDKEDHSGFDMMKTMRRPLNDALVKTIKRSEGIETDFQVQKSRAATPTKLSLGQRFQNGINAKTNFNQRRMQFESKFDDDLEEEELTRSGKTTPSRSSSRQFNNQRDQDDDDDDDNESTKNFRSESSKYVRRNSDLSKAGSRKHSPRDSLDFNEKNDKIFKEAYEKNIKVLNNLINPRLNKSDSRESEKKDDETVKKDSTYENSEKDPEFTETVEDKNISEKLQKEREQKRIERENRTKNMTDSSKRIEDAIEKVENTMEDNLRMNNLKEITNELKYSTKPTLEEILKNERMSRSRSINARERDNSRTRSLSSSGRFEKPFNNKYANVKPKTQTRLSINSARSANENSKLNTSKNDIMNDSSSLRQNIYQEWYEKKMIAAQHQLKEAKLKQKDQEEKKAQELIEKLQKSKLIFTMWSQNKEESIKEKRKVLLNTTRKEKEKEIEKIDKKKEAEIAFREWLRKKMEYEKDKKEEGLEKKRNEEKNKRKEKENVNNKKPPVPYDIWAKKKDNEIKEKQKTKEEIERQKRLEEKEKKKKKELAKKSFYEWLDKKEEENDLNKSRNLSTSMSSLPPFYPTSKTIPFGR